MQITLTTPYVRLAHKGCVDTAWFKARKREVKASDEKLAAAVGRDRTTVTKIINGDVRFDLSFVEGFARVLEVSPEEVLTRVGVEVSQARSPTLPTAGHTSKAPEQPVIRTADAGDTGKVLRLDLSYAMGDGTDLDRDYVEGEPFEFDLGFLRNFTISPPSRLRIVEGTGDSMKPTIEDRDMLLVDLNQRDLNAQDRIWAIGLFGAGAVKRLQLVAQDRVLVISDNRSVPDREVDRRDIVIVGRVVGSIRRH